jgi:hypothetical protein
MNNFTASNGIEISVANGASGTYLLGSLTANECADQTHATGSAKGIQALREFFQAEADERLGRWRWPEDPHLVVYPTEFPDMVRVLHEPNGQGMSYDRNEYPDHTTGYSGAGNAYFDAHPEPKPWHEASIGDVWVMEPLKVVYTVVGGNEKWFTRGDVFGKAERRDLDDPVFTAGRRIWPEVS